MFNVTYGHKITKTHWKRGKKAIPLGDATQVFEELRYIQSLDQTPLQPFTIDYISEDLRAIFKWAAGSIYIPQYRDFKIINKRGDFVAHLNGIIKFKVNDLMQGYVCLRFNDVVMNGRCTFRPWWGTLSFDPGEFDVAVGWDDGYWETRARGNIMVAGRECFELIGPSPLMSHKCSPPAYDLFYEGKKMGTIFREGQWTFSPVQIINRMFKDQIVIWKSNVQGVAPTDPQLVPGFVSAICTGLFVANPAVPPPS